MFTHTRACCIYLLDIGRKGQITEVGLTDFVVAVGNPDPMTSPGITPGTLVRTTSFNDDLDADIPAHSVDVYKKKQFPGLRRSKEGECLDSR